MVKMGLNQSNVDNYSQKNSFWGINLMKCVLKQVQPSAADYHHRSLAVYDKPNEMCVVPPVAFVGGENFENFLPHQKLGSGIF